MTIEFNSQPESPLIAAANALYFRELQLNLLKAEADEKNSDNQRLKQILDKILQQKNNQPVLTSEEFEWLNSAYGKHFVPIEKPKLTNPHALSDDEKSSLVADSSLRKVGRFYHQHRSALAACVIPQSKKVFVPDLKIDNSDFQNDMAMGTPFAAEPSTPVSSANSRLSVSDSDNSYTPDSRSSSIDSSADSSASYSYTPIAIASALPDPLFHYSETPDATVTADDVVGNLIDVDIKHHDAQPQLAMGGHHEVNIDYDDKGLAIDDEDLANIEAEYSILRKKFYSSSDTRKCRAALETDNIIKQLTQEHRCGKKDITPHMIYEKRYENVQEYLKIPGNQDRSFAKALNNIAEVVYNQNYNPAQLHDKRQKQIQQNKNQCFRRAMMDDKDFALVEREYEARRKFYSSSVTREYRAKMQTENIVKTLMRKYQCDKKYIKPAMIFEERYAITQEYLAIATNRLNRSFGKALKDAGFECDPAYKANFYGTRKAEIEATIANEKATAVALEAAIQLSDPLDTISQAKAKIEAIKENLRLAVDAKNKVLHQKPPKQKSIAAAEQHVDSIQAKLNKEEGHLAELKALQQKQELYRQLHKAGAIIPSQHL